MPRRRFRRIRLRQNNNFLVVLLSLIVLFETIILLFLLPTKKPVPQKTPVVVEKKIITPQKKKISPPPIIITKKPPVISPEKKEIKKRIKGKIAIVIDDWGYSTDNLEVLKEIKYPLTLAILPFRAYSQKIADFAKENNYEVIIHMPMEPEYKDKVDLEPKTIMLSMNDDIIKLILSEAFVNIPNAKGMNNHMGSLLTQKEKIIITIFKELKNKKLYFLDSLATPKSVCRKVSKRVGIKFAERSVFLDNNSDIQYIKSQLFKLAKESQKKGKAIGIGHDRDNTLKVLKEIIPRLSEEGYEFVFVSELAK